MHNKEGKTRRDFIKSTVVMASAINILPSRIVFGSEANEKVKLGLIGCGGRGRWIAHLFEKNAPFEITAVHDVFRKRAKRVAEECNVPDSKIFVGLNGYKDLLEADVEAVAIESPPYFHPEQVLSAVAKGKHVYLAKPIAVDVNGCLSLIDISKKYNNKLCLLVDFQTRNYDLFKECVQKIHSGMIGEPVIGQCYYYCSRLGKQAEPGTPGERLKNWAFDKILSGDIIVEQNIHVIDMANWYLKSHPLKAFGTGGRKARTDVGDCWDHFCVQFTYPNDVIVDFSSGQFTYGYDDLCMRLYGSLGTADTHYGGIVTIEGKSESWEGGKSSDIYEKGAVNNIKDFYEAIKSGKYLNNLEESAYSNLTSILGRMSAYQNRTVTWEEMINSNEKLETQLEISEEIINS
ncbi:MAG TPA: Gfo/Idh/MocA family oxidoreductase [Candidatus Hydrogenedens sp.]|nr:Gfo/Idh/MocA family oxidoreductase [Candidatus Hydrogenedens sp.]HOL20645.1 Gfo/Idh/MocA family oxidoreductase [Candidatus Hydrogenedens sp.]HPP58475.1 Gfo/Idh/MocA family oxidoreductase [Candidatus Hydrogenedens sp.]